MTKGTKIPTVVIINDDNEELFELEKRLRTKIRVYVRNSIQGEQLYQIREGLLYIDDTGMRQLTLQDQYFDAEKRVDEKLKKISKKSQELLSNFLERRRI